jgi:putative membrane protein
VTDPSFPPPVDAGAIPAAPAAPEPAAPGGAAPSAPAPPAAVRSPLSDGEWHRLHPLTPLLRGGLFLLVVIGIVVANLRDRLLGLLIPGSDEWSDVEGDPIDAIVENGLVAVAFIGVLVALVVVIVAFYVSWRFHTFRITGDDVEVRSGVLFRTHRRAPLDRVQGVNLTRPMIARLLGTAKLEVVGAGLDANVKLEYLSTASAEEVRGDILRLASGRQLAAAQRDPQRRPAIVETVGAGLTGLIDGVDVPTAEPESVVHLPAGRVIGSHLLSDSASWLVLLIVGIVVGSIVGTPWVLFSLVPMLIGFGAFWFRSITRSLRYSIAPTPAGVRITFGLFTTITETLPPGRIHAVQIRQPLLWRGLDWWTIRVNRLTGRSLSDSQAQQSADVLPVGSADDVLRVLDLLLPGRTASEWETLFRYGIRGPVDGDPYTTTPRRARGLRPLSWRRNGYVLERDVLLLRRGFLWRSVVILPLARLQSLRIEQGPLDRALDVATLTGHTVLGQVSGQIGIIDCADAVQVWTDAAHAMTAAAADDRSHRWDAEPDGAVDGAVDGDADLDDLAPTDVGASADGASADESLIADGPAATAGAKDAP